MNEAASRSRQSIAEEAAEWFVELQEKPPERSTRDRFVTWLTESPVHVEEYLAIAQVFGVLEEVDPGAEIDIRNLADETVVALHGESGTRDVLEQRTGKRSWLRLGIAASGLLAVATASLLYLAMNSQPTRYSTALGEQRSVVLEDGSMVSLNTSTTVEVAFTDETRQVHLMQGEALFDVEKDAARPFLVETASAVIRVTGTQFNVYEQDDSTAVTVLQGEVEVMPREASPIAVTARKRAEPSTSDAGAVANLKAGHQAVVKSGSAEIETITVASLEPVTAWTERRLVFDSTPLSDIVKQFNRYNRERLVLDDPDLASLELSGVFGSNDPQSLVLFLQRISGVDVVTSADGREIRIRAANTTH